MWPVPGGAGGRTTPASGHPSLKEGNVSGSLTSVGRRCILLRQLSPVRWPPPPRPKIRTTTRCRRAMPNRFRKQSRLRSRNIMESRRGTPPHPRKQHRSRDIPLLSGGVAEGRGGRPATAVRPLPTPPAPPPPADRQSPPRGRGRSLWRACCGQSDASLLRGLAQCLAQCPAQCPA